MEKKATLRTTLRIMMILCFVSFALAYQKRELDDKIAILSEWDVLCFSEYMELRIHSSVIEGLRVWLSGALQIPLDQLNSRMSACGFTLYKDTENNVTLRVSYSGCLVQQQDEHYILTLNLMKRMSRFGGRSQMLIMRCPEVSVPNTEYIQCDPEYVQVTRQVPYDNWNNEIPWSLSLGEITVALEDASLIQINVDMNRANISVQGRRREVLSPVRVLDHDSEFLALKLVSGQHAYSMEATCPTVIDPSTEETVLHIYKHQMGLTKRGSHVPETLTVQNVTMKQTENFTFHETSQFVAIIAPTAQILHLKSCPDNKQIWQPVYRVDVVLLFRETNHTVHWSMESALACSADLPNLNITKNLPKEASWSGRTDTDVSN